MTKEEFAKLLDGREIGDEISRDECGIAKDSGLVVVFGASDDLIEFRGAIDGEGGCYDGGVIPLVNGSLLQNHCDCECGFCGYKAIRAKAKTIRAIWDGVKAAATWTYKTDIPHATFMILEDGESYCQGIVFDFSEVK